MFTTDNIKTELLDSLVESFWEQRSPEALFGVIISVYYQNSLIMNACASYNFELIFMENLFLKKDVKWKSYYYSEIISEWQWLYYMDVMQIN